VINSLSGLRAVAVIAVMLHHCGAPLFAAGWVGVDLFFVLSGFLITSLLLREHSETGTISLTLFWARRFLRLMPIYVLYITGITAAILLSPATAFKTDPTWLVASLWTYTINFLPTGGIWDGQHLTIHLWSLAVEEQFYFVWPVVVVLLLRAGNLEAAAWFLVAAIALYNFTQPHVSHHLVHTRGIGLFIGCAVAISLQRDTVRAIAPRLGTVAAALALAVVAAMTYRAMRGDSHSDQLRIAVLVFDLLVAVMIAALWCDQKSRLAKLLSGYWLPAIGTISYGMYLYHMLAWDLTWNYILAGIGHWNAVPKYGARLALFFALTIGMAWLSYVVIERPFLNLKAKLRHVGKSAHVHRSGSHGALRVIVDRD
jgi:peptidoglycan/LPS O-acetylase OafA/YrhL